MLIQSVFLELRVKSTKSILNSANAKSVYPVSFIAEIPQVKVIESLLLELRIQNWDGAWVWTCGNILTYNQNMHFHILSEL